MERIIFIMICMLFLTSCQEEDPYQKDEIANLIISITFPDHIDPHQVKVDIPPLKFDKTFVYSYTFDDIPISAYNRGFCYINKKWVDDQANHHYTDDRTTGLIPDKTLGYTDGCGVERRFGLGLALWPNAGKNETWMDFYSSFNGYFIWSDLLPMLDFGTSIYFHDIDDRMWDPDNPQSIVLGFRADQKKTILKTGRGMKVLMRPNGNNTYLDAAGRYGDIVMFAHEMWGPQYVLYPKNPSFDLHKASQCRDQYTRENAENLYTKRVIASHDSDDGQWVHFFSHGTGADNFVIDHFVRLNNDYGKDGDDSMWFATLDEVYEYWYMRKNSKIVPHVAGQTLTIEMEVPVQQYFYFTDFSLLFSNVTAGQLVVNTSSNIYGLSYAVRDGALLMNVDFNKSLEDRAEKYSAQYEETRNNESLEDAVYFVNRLKEELRTPYLDRLGLPDGKSGTAR